MNDVQVVLPVSEPPKSIWDELVCYFSSKRKQFQDWDANPPLKLAFVLFLAVCAELALSFALIEEEKSIKNLLALFGLWTSGLLLLQFVFIRTAKEIGSYFNKTGNSLTAWALMSVALMPLLLFLPMISLMQLAGNLNQFRVLFFILLSLQVLSGWREAVEVAFELSRLQSAILIYALSGAIFFICGVAAYISLIKSISDFLS